MARMCAHSVELSSFGDMLKLNPSGTAQTMRLWQLSKQSNSECHGANYVIVAAIRAI